MHAAYHRETATSAAASLRDSVPATLPHHLRSNCLHALPPLGSPLENPHHPLQPRMQLPQIATRSIISAQPASAKARSQRKPSRCTQRTTEVQRRQLRHPSEARCQRRCPSCSDVITCKRRRRVGTPLAKPPPPATAPCATPAAQHASSSAHSRRSQAPAHSTAGRRCMQRTTEVQRRQLRHP